MKKELLELYSDYLLSSFGYTAAGLSDLPDNQIGHDRITDLVVGLPMLIFLIYKSICYLESV